VIDISEKLQLFGIQQRDIVISYELEKKTIKQHGEHAENSLLHNTPKLPWMCRLVWHSAKKRGGLVPQLPIPHNSACPQSNRLTGV